MSVGTATTPDMAPLHLDEAPAAPRRRPRVLFVGTAYASAASIGVFALLLGVYLSMRSQWTGLDREWLPSGAEIPLSPGNMSMATLAMSLVVVQWAVYAGHHRDRPHAYLALGLTILLGISHIVQMGYLWTQWGLPLNGEDGTTVQAVLLFTILGAHVAMVGAALIYFALMLLRSLGGQFTGPDAEGLSAAALYWWVTVGIYAVLWYAVLITK